MMAASIPFFLGFAKWQQVKMARDGSPLVVPALFTQRSFTAGLLINMIFQGAMIGFFLTLTLVIQLGLGFSPIHSALTGLPIAIGIALTMATMGQKVLPRLGRQAIWLGMIIMTIGLTITNFTFHHYTLHLHSWQLIPGLLLVGISMGFVFSSMFAATLNNVDVKHAGAASGVLNAVTQVGAAMGIAAIGVIFFGQINHGAATSFDSVRPQLQTQLASYNVPAPTRDSIITQAKQCYVDRAGQKDTSVIPGSCKSLASGAPNSGLTQAVGSAVLQANNANFNRAFKLSTIFEIVILAVVFVSTFALPKHFRANIDAVG